MHDHRLTAVLTGGLLIFGLLVLSSGGTTQADVSRAEVALEPRAYLPFLANSYVPVRYPSDVDYAKQWALEKINAPQAWALSTGPDIVIAVLDTGVDLDHPDLSSKLVSEGWHFLKDDQGAGADDDHWHGTHVAGIAAASTDNYAGVAGTGWDTKILPVKALDSAGSGSLEDIAKAIDYATSNGAHVINLSVGIETSQNVDCPWFLQDAIDRAYGAGVVVIAAAGNNGNSAAIPPANCIHALGVAATERDDTRAIYSSYGSHVNVAAPGGELTSQNTCVDGIYSTDRGGWYRYACGTSMATPHVSGLAALVLARYPTYTPEQVASAILDNAVDLGSSGWDQYYGCGRIDAYQSVLQGARSTEPLCLQGITVWAQEEEQEDTVADAPFAPGEVIVRFGAAPITAASLASQYATAAEHLPTLDAWRLHVPVGQERAVLARLRDNPDVLYAELNYLVSALD